MLHPFCTGTGGGHLRHGADDGSVLDCAGAIQTIMGASGLSAMEASTLPAEIASTIEDVGLLESIPLWAVTLLGSLFIWVLSLVMILTVYGAF